jgi:uncharacterized delta-60 repeat protein
MVHTASGDTYLIGFVTGANINSIIIKVNETGQKDNSFANNGVLTIDAGIGADDVLWTGNIDANGKIIAAGIIDFGNTQDMYVVRFDANGTLDTSFDANGFVVQDLTIGNNETPRDILGQPDGKILVSGTVAANGNNEDLFVCRLHTDGQLDYSFNQTGKLFMDPSNGSPESIESMQLNANNEIIGVGYTGLGSSRNMFAMRLKANGTLDSSFSQDGYTEIDMNGNQEAALSCHVYDDGKILLAGYEISNGEYNPALVKLAKNGNISLSLSQDGKVISDFNPSKNEAFHDVKVQDNGKIVCAGYIKSDSAKNDMLVARYEEDGSQDITFGTNGFNSIDASNRGNDDLANALAITGNGDILLAGMSGDSAVLVSVKGDAVSTGIFQHSAIDMQVNVWPNPFSQQIHVTIQTKQGEEVNYSLTDLSGREVLNGSEIAESSQTTINLQERITQLPPGGYLLQIAHGQDAIGTMLLKQ